jgi:glycerol kinase
MDLACCRLGVSGIGLEACKIKSFVGLQAWAMSDQSKTYILAIDQGTSGTSASVVDLEGRFVATSNIAVRSSSPAPGWIEQDPYEILDSVRRSVQTVMQQEHLRSGQIQGVGFANQGESLLLWDRDSGEPIYNLIGWQCTRSLDTCQRFVDAGHTAELFSRTGLRVDPEWPATKIPWVLEHVPQAKELLSKGRLAFSMGDAWLLYQLTKGTCFITDHSTASRSGVYNLQKRTWDDRLLQLFQGEGLILPELVDNAGDFGIIDLGDGSQLPLNGLALDQSAALLGQACVRPGELKVTYGTCASLWCNAGGSPVIAKLLGCSLAWQLHGIPTYAWVGEEDIAASVLHWLRENLGATWTDEELSSAARSAVGEDDLLFVPAMHGLGAPHWRPDVRGVIYGLSTTTSLDHLLRAALQAIAFSVRDMLEALAQEQGISVPSIIMADGGMAANEYLMQFQADILGMDVVIPENLEATSKGVVTLVRLAQGIDTVGDRAQDALRVKQVFHPRLSGDERERLYSRWRRCIGDAMAFYVDRPS